MSRLWFSGLETGDFSEFAGVSGAASVVSTVKRSGKYSMAVAEAGGYAIPVFAASSLLYVKVAMTVVSTATNSTLLAVSYISDATTPCTAVGMTWDHDLGLVYIYPLVWDGAAFQFFTGAPYAVGSVGVPIIIEMKYLLGTGANSTAEVRVNGVVVGTQTSGPATFSADRFVLGTLAAFTGGTVYFDDLVVENTGYPGNTSIIARQGKTGTPNVNAWTKTGGATSAINWSETPFATANNCNKNTTNSAQTMLVAPSSDDIGPNDTILVSKVSAIAKASVAAGSLSLRRRIAAANTDTVITTTTTDKYFEVIFAATSLANIDGAEIGGVTGASGTSVRTIEDMWLQTEFYNQVRPTAPWRQRAPVLAQ